ncbi:MAG: MFS transporter [Candidatus Carbobacillus altaicus]|uniref:Major facilitator superfamily (MFS) profile domain-containing protein n=1 Tax=Candidatus Carbonibacillus altaicus TaxID=2163959 RepID=A0A2R6Y563_9BACL|nr:MFS transporter [Candidatus Carbobacillus altaicus]PTQ57827.1 MAG: hypothetical protein BSOLF_0689 [Candidatus Carbobacillus altaicus]
MHQDTPHLSPEESAMPAERKAKELFLSAPVIGWMLYDAANTVYSSNVVTLFFPFYLTQALGAQDQLANTFVSYANAISAFFLVLLSPLYGVWMDATGRKKAFLYPFTLVAVLSTVLMGIMAQFPGKFAETTLYGLPFNIFLVLIFFVIGKFFFQSSVVFYDNVLGDLGRGKELPLISGFGVSFGYFGTLLGLTVYLLVGNDFASAFLPTALLYFLLTVPFFFSYRDRPRPAQKKLPLFAGYREIVQTFLDMRLYRNVFLLMIAYFFINDALATAIAMMTVYARTVVGLESGAFLLLYLVSTISTIIGSFALGFFARRYGSKNGLLLVSVILLLALGLATFTVNAGMFWAAGSLYGIAMGSVWVTSRVLIVELAPPEKRGQFFGLFAFSGRVSSIIGPFVYGTIALIFQQLGATASRLALGSLMLFVLIGVLILFRVPGGSSSQPASQHI